MLYYYYDFGISQKLHLQLVIASSFSPLPACPPARESLAALWAFSTGVPKETKNHTQSTLNPSQQPNTPCDRVHSPPLFPPPGSFVQITFFIHPSSFHLLFKHPSLSTYTLPGNANNAFVRGCGQRQLPGAVSPGVHI